MYRERVLALPGAVLWERAEGVGPASTLILPDGCLDLIWDGDRVFVAGPDSSARWHHSPGGQRYLGLRLAGGVGPCLLGVEASEVLDRTPDLTDLLPARAARRIADAVAADPVGALAGWAHAAIEERPLDPVGLEVHRLSAAGAPVAAIADRVGLSPRQLQRRCLALFGYGPRHLRRVLRLGRAVDAVRAGAGLAAVAACSGFADQAHLCREVKDLTGVTPSRLLEAVGAREEGVSPVDG